MKKVLMLFLGVCLLIGLATSACGTTETKPAATKPAETVTVEKTVTETEPADAEEAEPIDAEEAEPVEEEAPAETAGQQNARESAESYLSFAAFSRKGLIDQLKYEGYSTKDATYAVDAVSPNWKKQAAKSAKSYLEMSSFSRSGLIEQLQYEGFTEAQATYGVNKTGL